MTEEAVLENLQSEIDLARVELEKTKLEIAEKKIEVEKYKYNERPLRELSADEKIVVDKHLGLSTEKKALEAKIEAEKSYDNVKVTGRFMNRRAPGNPAKLTYLKYADDPVKWYTFNDGAVYTIPRGFADQINEHYYRPAFIQKDGALDPSNPSQIHAVDTSNKSYAFVPTTF